MPNYVNSDTLLKTPDVVAPADTAVRKYFSAEKLETVGEQSARRMRFVISTADVDRDNDTVNPMGWDLSNYKNNPVVLWAHSHRDLPIARAVEVGVEGNSLVAVAEFATHPFAQTVFDLLKGGFLRAVSVGFRAVKYSINEERRGVDFMEQELLEFSVCPVPANPMALVSASAAGVDMEPMRKWVQDVIEQWPGDLKLKGSAWDKLRAEPPAADTDLQGVRATLAEIKTQLATLASTQASKATKDDEADVNTTPAPAAPVAEADPAPAPEPAKEPEAPTPAADVPAPSEATAGDEPVLDIDLEVAPAADEPVITLADDPLADLAAEAGMTEQELRSCISVTVRDALAQVVQGAVEGAINHARGRLD